MGHSLALTRLALGGAVGTALALVLPHAWAWETRALVGWNAFCGVNLLRLTQVMRFSGDKTRQHATREDEVRSVAATLTLLAVLVSLVGVFFTLRSAAHAQGSTAYWLTGLAVLTTALSWSLLQAEYMLHYARRFYTDGGAGVHFVQRHSDDPLPNPNYFDFLYLSLTIGMTYQVSDTNLNTPQMRQLLLGHAALSYFFNVVIVAVTVSGVAGLFS